MAHDPLIARFYTACAARDAVAAAAPDGLHLSETHEYAFLVTKYRWDLDLFTAQTGG